MSNQSSPFPSCFRPSAALALEEDLALARGSGKPNLSTSLYQTDLGLFSLTWSRTFFQGHSLHLQLHPIDDDNYRSPLSLSNLLSLSTVSFYLDIKSFAFWKKHGSKDLHFTDQEPCNTKAPRLQIFWDLSRAKFGSGPEAHSGYFIAVVVGREMVLLVGDLTKEAYRKTKAQRPPAERTTQVLVMRKEHVLGDRVYTTKTRFGGKNREISIDWSPSNESRLCFSIDKKRVLQIKRLKWKFRGNEKIEVDGVPIQVSWDVYNWLFDDMRNKHAVFTFRFETLDLEEEEEEKEVEKNAAAPWEQNWMSSGGFGTSVAELRKMRKSLLMMKTARSSSSSSISISSASSGCSSSVMEWASAEESELRGPGDFCLLVYAWKKK
uniref:Uncharacterized protein LOC105134078 n=1 Tax=Rhizophora mucronata TaxID=61149 RepID=A0A2P2NP82_RHIMU